MASENTMKELKEEILKWNPSGFKQLLVGLQPPIKIKSVFLVFFAVFVLLTPQSQDAFGEELPDDLIVDSESLLSFPSVSALLFFEPLSM